MEDKTLEALKESIEHWRRVVANPHAERIGAGACALCELFNKLDESSEENCIGCPVFEATGRQYCYGSPYTDVIRFSPGQPEYLRLAQEELEFLKSLLP